MRGAIAISSSREGPFPARHQCRGNPPAVRPRVPPDPPTPTSRPNPIISNRESTRLGIRLTQRKKNGPGLMIQPGEMMTTNLIGKKTHVFQTGSGLSIVFAIAGELTVSAIAEQLIQPGEIGSGLRKEKNQTIGTLKYCFSRNSLKIKDRVQNNRDTPPPIRNTPTNYYSNFSLSFRPSFRPSFLPPQSTPHQQFTDPNPNYKPPQNPKNTKIPPQSLFRLERTPTLYFHQLTRILNEPMFRLETELHSTCHQGHCPAVPFSPPAPRANLFIRCPNAANQSDAARGSVSAFRFASTAGLRTTALFET
jgi:hypothetical protein